MIDLFRVGIISQLLFSMCILDRADGQIRHDKQIPVSSNAELTCDLIDGGSSGSSSLMGGIQWRKINGVNKILFNILIILYYKDPNIKTKFGTWTTLTRFFGMRVYTLYTFENNYFKVK